MNGTYYKVVGITVDAISAEIIADGNVKSINEVSSYIAGNIKGNEYATWIIMPCSYNIDQRISHTVTCIE